ncbi:MAG: hypothetical protein K5945_08590, partial [Bacteroidaceae bacterium]|nr:hypothetical protein [Bacteroidaceae bacterium]
AFFFAIPLVCTTLNFVRGFFALKAKRHFFEDVERAALGHEKENTRFLLSCRSFALSLSVEKERKR